MRLEPVEHGREPLLRTAGRQVPKSLPIRIQQHIVQPAGEIFRLREIRERHFVARHLVGRPVGQPLHVSQIGHRHAPVEFVHPGRIDTRHLEPIAARTLLRLDEKHLDLIAGHKAPSPGQRSGRSKSPWCESNPRHGATRPRADGPEKRPIVTAVHPLSITPRIASGVFTTPPSRHRERAVRPRLPSGSPSRAVRCGVPAPTRSTRRFADQRPRPGPRSR